MTDRDRIDAMIQDAVSDCYPYWSIVIADHLIAGGVVVREKGEWIEDRYYGNPFVCSCCGHEGCYSDNYDDKDYYPTNFCPNCGADMRKEAAE